ncbi:unnamed protein product [Gongylonema pulchrum]|uniref:Coiled-coil domain-containing protein 149 n=1 Tax=Gongylonema pulchrum TaxID=637853 RepID=A0A183E4H1_9BILA|nr:unnamed protein product [Gongylonema pulchrum]
MAAAVALNVCPECVVYRQQLEAKEAEITFLKEYGAELEHKVHEVGEEKKRLEGILCDRLTQLNDNNIKIRSLEEQLQSALDRSTLGELSRADLDGIISRDLDNIHSQLVLKDRKIMELNNTILEKERHILDLQEMCREQDELARAKTKAFQIVQQKLLDLTSRTTREDSTETDTAYLFESPSSTTSSSTSPHYQKIRRHQRESASPGHAVLNFKTGNSGSPPPLDPSEEQSSITLETATNADEFDADDSNGAFSYQRKKQRKKVTFDLPPRKELNNNGEEVDDNIAQAIIDLTSENDQLRQTIQEMERCANETQSRLSQVISLFL